MFFFKLNSLIFLKKKLNITNNSQKFLKILNLRIFLRTSAVLENFDNLIFKKCMYAKIEVFTNAKYRIENASLFLFRQTPPKTFLFEILLLPI